LLEKKAPRTMTRGLWTERARKFPQTRPPVLKQQICNNRVVPTKLYAGQSSASAHGRRITFEGRLSRLSRCGFQLKVFGHFMLAPGAFVDALIATWLVGKYAD